MDEGFADDRSNQILVSGRSKMPCSTIFATLRAVMLTLVETCAESATGRISKYGSKLSRN
jgi:hypothetical protein